MAITAQTPSRSVPRRRLPFLVWVGLAMLAVSAAWVGWGMHLSASDGPNASATAPPPASLAGRAVTIAYVDVEGGVISLYPLQPGRVVKIEVKENQAVNKGAVLLTLDDTLAKETLVEAQADLASAEAQLKQARLLPQQHAKQLEAQQAVIDAKQSEVEVARLRRDDVLRLKDKELAREEQVKMADQALKGLEDAVKGEKAKLEGLKTIDPNVGVTRAEQAVKVKRAQVAKARFGLSECTLTAPCDGTVLRLQVSEGETLGANPRQSVVDFCPKKPRIIRAEVEQEFANRVVLGQTAEIQDDIRSGPTWKGKVVQISDWFTRRRSILQEPLQFNDVRTLECIIELDPSTPPLRIGQRMRVVLGGSAN